MNGVSRATLDSTIVTSLSDLQADNIGILCLQNNDSDLTS
jgi:hypothetical protein